MLYEDLTQQYNRVKLETVPKLEKVICSLNEVKIELEKEVCEKNQVISSKSE